MLLPTTPHLIHKMQHTVLPRACTALKLVAHIPSTSLQNASRSLTLGAPHFMSGYTTTSWCIGWPPAQSPPRQLFPVQLLCRSADYPPRHRRPHHTSGITCHLTTWAVQGPPSHPVSAGIQSIQLTAGRPCPATIRTAFRASYYYFLGTFLLPYSRRSSSIVVRARLRVVWGGAGNRTQLD